jgi:hypothetical protein
VCSRNRKFKLNFIKELKPLKFRKNNEVRQLFIFVINLADQYLFISMCNKNFKDKSNHLKFSSFFTTLLSIVSKQPEALTIAPLSLWTVFFLKGTLFSLLYFFFSYPPPPPTVLKQRKKDNYWAALTQPRCVCPSPSGTFVIRGISGNLPSRGFSDYGLLASYPPPCVPFPSCTPAHNV